MRQARDIAEQVRNGAVSPVTVVEECFAAIDAWEPLLDAWVEVDREAALQRARELEAARARGEHLGLLAGVPVGVKDIIDVVGFTTRAGAPSFAHYKPSADATIATRLRQAGAVIIGKTHTTQFAYLDPAPTRNPWNREHTPGGSSSGSGAAGGAGIVPLAIGSQTVGSVLRPAGYCGAAGFKPSFGRISYAGTLGLAPTFDHLGVICSSVADAALAVTALSGYDAADGHSLDAPIEDFTTASSAPAAPRLGIPRNYYRGTAEPDTEAHLDDVASRFAAAGAEVVEVSFPATAPEISDIAMQVMRYEAAIAHAERYAEHKDEYRPNLRGLIEAGRATDESAYNAAKQYVLELRASLDAILRQVDAILLPTAPSPAPAGLESTGAGIFCGPATFTGLPSISLPSGVAASGLPYSIQLIGPHLGESKLLAAAAWAESTIDFRERPQLPGE